MVCAQLVAFDRVSQSRAKGKERKELNKEEARVAAMNGNGNGNGKLANGHGCVNGHGKEPANGAANDTPHRGFWDDDYEAPELARTETETTEEEMIL